MTDRKRTILCVDDEERDLQLQRYTFEEAGFDVSLARDLGEVKANLQRQHIHAVVLDYRLMNADPIHIAISVRKLYPRMPIVILSGFVDDIPEYFKRAVDACMHKNQDRADWVNVVQSQIGPQGATANGG